MIFWNQKEVLFKEIRNYIKKYKIKSILDIGAGDGVLAKNISSVAEDYLALESKTKNVNNLIKSGLRTIRTDFPNVKLNKKYDLVISSHSIPENTKKIGPFLNKAWSCVKTGGLLLVITFKGGKGDTFKFKKEIDGNSEVFDKNVFDEVLKNLNKFGDYKIKRKLSTLKSKSIDEVVNEMDFSLGAGKYNKKRVEDFIKKNLKDSQGNFFIKYEHLFIVVKK